MSKYCIVCGKEKEWENPFIEGEPCDECANKVNRALKKLISMRSHKHISSVNKNDMGKR
jgi:hypothetical protein